MIVFKSYNDTYHSLQIEKANLQRLEDIKSSIYNKHFKITSSPKDLEKDLNCIITADICSYNDKFSDYLIELDETKQNGIKLEDLIRKQRNIVNKLNYYLKLMDYHLSKMNGIEYQIFYEVIKNKKNITKAIETVAEKNHKDAQTIWKNYYPAVKQYLNTYVEY